MTDDKKTKILKPMMIMLTLMALLFGGIFFYKAYQSAAMQKSMTEGGIPPVAVSAMPVPSESWQTKITATGTIRAINGVDVTTEITGLVKTIKQNAGKDIKEGEVLIELNANAETAQLHALEADAELAQVIYERDKKQYAIQGVSKATLDTDAANVKSKKALADQQAAIVAKKTIRAPFSGRLGIINISVGQFLNPGDKIAPLQSLDPIYVDFYLPQQELTKIKPGQLITLTTDSYRDLNFTGKITTINPRLDPATRNVTVEASLTNPDKKLLPGMYGVVDITVGSPKEHLTLPQAAITYNPYGDAVYTLKEHQKDHQGKSVEAKTQEEQKIYVAHQKFVTLGETRGDQVQILKGLEKGDLVVTSGQLKLKNGSLVLINNKVIPTNNPNPHYKNK
ncbi:MAG: efflux RND transporter periplasmic adaptor subunit [Alphaproteobacteria bacterium]|nr:efflux RND transporter periplasmic adaptor subunit [Alphaproteobacteria bacterium]